MKPQLPTLIEIIRENHRGRNSGRRDSDNPRLPALLVVLFSVILLAVVL